MRGVFISFLLIPICLNIFAQEKIIPIIIDGDEVSYLREEQKVTAKGNVVMKYKGIILNCDEAIYDAITNQAFVTGNVKISSEEGIITAVSGIYDFNNKTAEIKDIRVESPPIYGEAQDGKKISDQEYKLENGYVTTCDLEKPHYRLTSKSITIYPKVKIVGKNMLLRIGNTPVFYIPYYSHSLKDKSFPVELSPGKNKDWGYYVLTRWRYYLNEENRGKVHLDWYEQRGLGAGITHKAKTTKFGEGLLNYYFIDDELYQLEKRDELFDKYSERSSISSKYLENNRYKGQFSYSWQPNPNLSINSEFHKFSDEHFMKDYFYREYEIEPHPLSYTLADYAFSNSSFSLLTQKRANHFFEEIEYLPKLEYNFYRQNISKFPLFFESKTFVSNTTKKFANSSLDDDAARMHSHNVFSYQTRVAWLSLSPYTGIYSTFYSKNIFGDEDVWRQAPEAGISLSTKLYKIFPQSFTLFGENIGQMRHVVTPSISYSYIHEPTVSKLQLFQFDEADDLERKESLIFKLENKLQAKNEKRTWDFLYFSPYVEYKINQEGKGSFFDNVKADLEFFPKEGLSLTADSNYDYLDRAFKEVNMDLGIRDVIEEKYSVLFGHRYARDESSQSTLSLSYQLTPRLRLSNYLRYEYRTGDFKEQQYALRVDLHCWWMDLGLDVDKDSNFTIWVIFRLKAFPEIHMGFDHTYHGTRQNY